MKIRLEQTNNNLSWLKLLAIVTMVFDHTVWGYCVHVDPGNQWYGYLRMPGRICIPIFSFLIAWNMVYNTHNCMKYIKRLWLLSLISEPVFYVYFQQVWNAFIPLAIGASLDYSISHYQDDPRSRENQITGLLIFIILGLGFTHSFALVSESLLIPFAGLWLRKSNYWYLVIGLLLIPTLNGLHWQYLIMIPVTITLIILCFTPALKLKRLKFPKWAAYWFYPLHLLVLFGIWGPA